jgi:hypothetical protein
MPALPTPKGTDRPALALGSSDAREVILPDAVQRMGNPEVGTDGRGGATMSPKGGILTNGERPLSVSG